MSCWLTRLIGAWCVSLVLWGASGDVATAQVAFVPASNVSSDITGYLEQGRVLEGDRRWAEALSLYEDALRTHPHDPHLEQRFNMAKAHYDLTRRYNDVSFRDAVASMPSRDALDLYVEVLLKIQSHYVESLDWSEMIEHGTHGFEVALADPIFIERNLPQVAQSRIESFRRSLRTRLGTPAIDEAATGRLAARNVAEMAAQLAHQELGLTESAVVLEYVCGAANSLDHYSTYLTSGQLNEVYSQIEGNFVGLGIELRTTNNMLEIVKVISRSPAEKAGMRAGDKIVAIDGRNISNYSTDQAANLLQGKEGTSVQVTVTSPTTRPRTVMVRREQIEVPSIDNVKMVDTANGVGYFKLTCFQKTTSRDLDEALWRLHKQGMRTLIMDLRGNPGGLLTTSVDVVDRFVDSGVIVSTRGRNTLEDYSYSAHSSGTWRMPLIVLIDGDSASASEIFAGAIRDHHRGTIVGTRSYGKGSVQGIFPLNVSGSGLRLTTAKFFSPDGLPFSDVGVQPDVLVQQTARPVGGDGASLADRAGDPTLEAALNIVRRQVAGR